MGWAWDMSLKRLAVKRKDYIIPMYAQSKTEFSNNRLAEYPKTA